MNKYLKAIDAYTHKATWETKENSNATYSYGALGKHVLGEVMKDYWLDEVYPKEITKAHRDGLFHIHDLGGLTIYCCGYSLGDIILKGVRGVSNIPTSKPAAHFDSLLSQVANLTTIYQNEIMG